MSQEYEKGAATPVPRAPEEVERRGPSPVRTPERGGEGPEDTEEPKAAPADPRGEEISSDEAVKEPVSTSPDSGAGRAGGGDPGGGLDAASGSGDEFEAPLALPRFLPRRRGRRLKKPELPRGPLTPQQRLLVLDCWKRSGLPAGDFSALVGLSKHTLYAWKRRFDQEGPAGLMDKPKGGPRGSRLPEVTRRAILLMKESHPEWGSERISHLLLRGPALPASPQAVSRVLREAGYELEEVLKRPHDQEPKRFERARPNQLWQTDLFTFVLKRQNRRVYLVAFLDDHSRFVVGYGVHATASTAVVIEVLRSAIVSWKAPEELLSDNGPQYVTWRGKSAFARELERRGIRHVVSSPRRPQTLGKIERFWGSLWRELLETAVFLDLADCHRRVGLWIDHYNFQRPHQGIGGLVPADRFFGASEEVLRTLKSRVSKDALSLARHGVPRAPFYLTGTAGGKSFSVHAEGERVILRRGEGEREEVELTAQEEERRREERELPHPVCPSIESEDADREEGDSSRHPGTSPLDPFLESKEDEEKGGES